MKSFEPGVLDRQMLPSSLLRTVRLLGQYRAATPARSARLLDRLRQTALVGSIGSSCRLDGIVVSPDRLHALIFDSAPPDTRAEQEIAGQREARGRLACLAAAPDFTPQDVLRLHADLYRYVPEGGGHWILSDDLVTETLPDGSTAVIFTPVPAYAVEDAMNRLHDGFARRSREGVLDPLVLIPAYLLDFVCIHPFSDGTDRMVRLLAMLLLERAGYHVASTMPLDSLFEQTHSAWSAALQASWRGWHGATHDLAPWTTCFLGIVLQAYQNFERDIDVISPPRGSKRDRVADAVRNLPAEFRYSDLQHLAPAISRPTINRVLRRLRAERVVRCVRPGRDARWEHRFTQK